MPSDMPQNLIRNPADFDILHVESEAMQAVDPSHLKAADDPGHPPRVLLLYGSIRERSFSRLVAEESERLLKWQGCETCIFDPRGLPQPDGDESHPKAKELREAALWAEAMVWVSPERHGAMTGILKSQIDWIPLAPIGGVRPSQGKTLAVMQVSGGSQSFNAVNQMRILGRWMRMVTSPTHSSVAKAWLEFDDNDRMKASPYYNRIVDVTEELVKFTWMTRMRSPYLVDRYSERAETRAQVHERVSKK